MARPKKDPLDAALAAYCALDAGQAQAFHQVLLCIERMQPHAATAPKPRAPKQPEAPDAGRVKTGKDRPAARAPVNALDGAHPLWRHLGSIEKDKPELAPLIDAAIAERDALLATEASA
jgi:hypothetical protein